MKRNVHTAMVNNCTSRFWLLRSRFHLVPFFIIWASLYPYVCLLWLIRARSVPKSSRTRAISREIHRGQDGINYRHHKTAPKSPALRETSKTALQMSEFQINGEKYQKAWFCCILSGILYKISQEIQKTAGAKLPRVRQTWWQAR